MKSDNRRKVIITQQRAPGDALVLTAAIRDLHLAYPGEFVTDVKTGCPELWNGNPYIGSVDRTKKDITWITADCPEILRQVRESYLTGHFHYITAYHDVLSQQLNIQVKPLSLRGDIHPTNGMQLPGDFMSSLANSKGFWIINAGGKRDFTNKLWEFARYQAVVNALPNILFVQIGRSKHLHPVLKGRNVINLIDKTNIRQLISLAMLSSGVITGVSFPMHLAAALPGDTLKPCIVIAGARENKNWEAYPWHYYISRDNMLFCCKKSGCWKDRVERLEDGERHDESICRYSVISKSGQRIPKCMDMITVDEVVNAVKMYEGIY